MRSWKNFPHYKPVRAPASMVFSNRFISALSFSIEHVGRCALYCLSAVALVFARGAEMSAAELKVTPINDGQFVGATGCKSSSCHGGAGEKRSQYITWLEQDFHARSYAVLINARSARITETLALPAAQTSNRCTVCHSPFQSVVSERLMPSAHVDEGVSCESCHNAAGSWLRGHTRKDWNYAMRVTAGMRDLRSYYVRANTCVACHENLDSDIIKAGHPELRFELDGQSVSEPKHWRDDDPSTGPRAWLVGQAVALREISWTLSKDATPDAETIARWNGLIWLLAKTTAQQTRLPVIGLPSETANRDLFVAVQGQADLLARRAAEGTWSDEFAPKILQTLAATDSEFVGSKEPRDTLFRRAERLVIALDRLFSAVYGPLIGTTKNNHLAQLFDDLKSRSDFNAAVFANHLSSFRATI
ncbi:MAG: cytochrome c family protein, partial [Verrucomicrobiota bacterium]|nr:cytochrome c family protein [Verrucomicrobiota bacterium]